LSNTQAVEVSPYPPAPPMRNLATKIGRGVRKPGAAAPRPAKEPGQLEPAWARFCRDSPGWSTAISGFASEKDLPRQRRAQILVEGLESMTARHRPLVRAGCPTRHRRQRIPGARSRWRADRTAARQARMTASLHARAGSSPSFNWPTSNSDPPDRPANRARPSGSIWVVTSRLMVNPHCQFSRANVRERSAFDPVKRRTRQFHGPSMIETGRRWLGQIAIGLQNNPLP